MNKIRLLSLVPEEAYFPTDKHFPVLFYKHSMKRARDMHTLIYTKIAYPALLAYSFQEDSQ